MGMAIITEQFGSLQGLLTARATFVHASVEDEDGYSRPNTVPHLTDVPCMPATGRNTRQDGITYVALGGSLPFETKWCAIDLTPETRGKVLEEDRVTIVQKDRRGRVLSDETYIVSGVTEYDAPDLGFAFALLNLKEEK